MNNDERILQILDRSACLSSSQMMAYLKGTLVPEELRAVELHLAECALCNDAIEGFRNQEHPEELIKLLAPPELPAMEPEKKTVTAAPVAKTPVPTVAETRKAAASSKGRPERNRKRRKNPLSGAIGIAALLLAGIFAIWFFEIRKGGSSRERPMAEEMTSRVPNDSFRVPEQNGRQIAAVKTNETTNDATTQPSDKDSLPAQVVARVDSLAIQSTSASRTSLPVADSQAENAPAATKLAGERTKNDSGLATSKTVAAAAPEKEKSQSASQKAATAKTSPKTKATKESPEAAAPHSDFETGVALYKKKEYASALLYLNTVTSDKDHPRYWDGLYYSALCNLALGKEGRARRYLRRVAKSSSSLKNEAARRLEALEKD